MNPDQLASEIAPILQANLDAGVASSLVTGTDLQAAASRGISLTELFVGAANRFSLGTIAPDNDLVEFRFNFNLLKFRKSKCNGWRFWCYLYWKN